MFQYILLLVGLPVLFFYCFRKFYKHRTFKRLGIPGPEPHWLFGNTLQILREDRHLVMANWSAKYGDFYGIYYGGLPILVTRSVEAVEKICVKQSNDFQGHMVWPITPDSDRDPDHPQSHLFNSEGETWKRIHAILMPAFATGKIKSFMPHIASTQADLLDYLSDKAKTGQAFDVREGFRLLTFEIIGKIGVGIDFGLIKNRQGHGSFISQNVRAYLRAVASPPLILYVSMILTELAGVLKFIIYSQMKFGTGFFGPMETARKAVKFIVQQRRQSSQKSNDILQQMIDVANNQESSKQISEKEITAQCFLLFSAGNETTAIALSLVSYLLAKNQHVQEKLYRELVAMFPSIGGKFPEIDHDIVMNQCRYLDWVCKESLRLYPSSMNLLSRYVSNDTSLCGITIPKTIWGVLIDNWTIHYNSELWGPNPEDFVPERFSPEISAERPTASFLPFGFGPRICLGQRLAFLIMKYTLANILLRYKISEPDGGYPGGAAKFSSKNGVIAIEEIPLKFTNHINIIINVCLRKQLLQIE